MKHVLLASLSAVLLVVWTPASALAQSGKTFKARLSPVPIDVSMQATVAGSGSVTAVLTGSRLVIDGTFNGLRSPATTARVHLGRKGVRGPAFFDLKVSSGTSGTIGGTLQLTPLQIDGLDKESFYVQLDSEKAPDGNLWGWLLQPEARR